MHLFHLPLILSASTVLARWSLTEDFYAFPKYRVSFLNGLPVLNETAERWLQLGLKGGESEFLDQPWQDRPRQSANTLKAIESGDAGSSVPLQEADDVPKSSPYRLQRLQLARENPYICLIPPPVESHLQPIEEPQIETSAAQSLSLLQPLVNSCIYHRQGWFTYAYCHNSHVRQFREMAHAHPHHAVYVPEEDPEWEAYTLGQAAALPSEARELTNAQQEILVESVDIVKTAGHRYLVQKMGDGTMCDKTGKPREIEVQIMTDTILFVKETSTCRYVMVIHTPRLCGEPGFKTRLEQREEAIIRCREVVDSAEAVAAIDKTLPAAAHPFKRQTRQPILDIPPPPPRVSANEENKHAGLIKAAIEALLSGNAGKERMHDGGEGILVSGEDGDVLIDIEFIDAEDTDDALDKIEGLLGKASGKLEWLEEALRAAGHDVSAKLPSDTTDASEKEEKAGERTSEGEKRKSNHEEL